MRRLRRWLTNRVMIGLVLFFGLIGFWEFKWKPQYRPFYEQGVGFYQGGKYLDALAEFDRAYAIAPNSVDVILMEGWSNLKIKRYEEARMFFTRALKIDPRTEEAQMGSAFVALETGRGAVDYKTIIKYLGKRTADPNVAILAAGALVQEGNNVKAAEIYAKLANDTNYGEAARLALNQLLGLEGFDDSPTVQFASGPRPQQLQANFRATNGAMWRLKPTGWEKYYITGVNLGPGSPGFYPGAPPDNGQTYATWIREAEQMNGNTLRAYTLLPPSFYRAYKHHTDAGGKINLYQQIWIGDPPNNDLYDPKFVEQSKAEIRYVVDAIHGHGDVPQKHARGSGVFTNDVSANVAGLLLGREIEASTTIQTNIINGGKQKYDGKYISINNGNATEVWFAEMLDYMIGYETDTYNWQHPVAIVNWPPMDPLNHPTEAPNLEEVKYRIRHGEKLELPKKIEDDNDAIAIDEAKYQVKPAFYAGLFASYHVYPYYPDFLIFDKGYLNAQDSVGLNPMYGYIKELHAHIPHPLVITEYGVPNSIGISHFHPYGMHHGGHTEAEQAQIIQHLSRGIKESGSSGGLIFSLVDEWYKHNWLTVDFEEPLERANLWLNELDPEKRYGMVGFHPSRWQLFGGDASEWATVPTLYNKPDQNGLRNVQAASDEAFLYLRINGVDKSSYALALNTLPNATGLKQLPFGNISMSAGANFLMYLGQQANGKMLIADSYNPYQMRARAGLPNESELSYKRSFTPRLEDHGAFQELVVETNRRRFGRDGTLYPGQRYSRSPMRYAADEQDKADSMAEWYVDAKNKAIVVRIPWGKLMITDPSSRRAFYGFNGSLQLTTIFSVGIDITVFQLKESNQQGNFSGMSVVNSFPPVNQGQVDKTARYSWKGWEKVQPEQYFKKTYYVMQKEFLEQNSEQSQASNSVAGAAGGHAVGSSNNGQARGGKASGQVRSQR